ncbi:MAG: hypothetical protein ACKVOH_02915 [Chlamydiales bacterium]
MQPPHGIDGDERRGLPDEQSQVGRMPTGQKVTVGPPASEKGFGRKFLDFIVWLFTCCFSRRPKVDEDEDSLAGRVSGGGTGLQVAETTLGRSPNPSSTSVGSTTAVARPVFTGPAVRSDLMDAWQTRISREPFPTTAEKTTFVARLRSSSEIAGSFTPAREAEGRLADVIEASLVLDQVAELEAASRENSFTTEEEWRTFCARVADQKGVLRALTPAIVTEARSCCQKYRYGGSGSADFAVKLDQAVRLATDKLNTHMIASAATEFDRVCLASPEARQLLEMGGSGETWARLSESATQAAHRRLEHADQSEAERAFQRCETRQGELRTRVHELYEQKHDVQKLLVEQEGKVRDLERRLMSLTPSPTDDVVRGYRLHDKAVDTYLSGVRTLLTLGENSAIAFEVDSTKLSGLRIQRYEALATYLAHLQAVPPDFAEMEHLKAGGHDITPRSSPEARRYREISQSGTMVEWERRKAVLWAALTEAQKTVEDAEQRLQAALQPGKSDVTIRATSMFGKEKKFDAAVTALHQARLAAVRSAKQECDRSLLSEEQELSTMSQTKALNQQLVIQKRELEAAKAVRDDKLYMLERAQEEQGAAAEESRVLSTKRPVEARDILLRSSLQPARVKALTTAIPQMERKRLLEVVMEVEKRKAWLATRSAIPYDSFEITEANQEAGITAFLVLYREHTGHSMERAQVAELMS